MKAPLALTLIALCVTPALSVSTAAQPAQSPPRVEHAALGEVRRTSGAKDRQGSYLPPWTGVTVGSGVYSKRAAVGDKVTVIPLGVRLAPFDLKIVDIKRWPNGCDERLPDEWEFELEPVRARELFQIEPLAGRAGASPFDVCVIYPAARGARSLPPRRLGPGALPRGVVPEVVAAAVDLTGDGRPEVVITRFCCGDERRPSSACDLTCGRTYRRTRGVWRLLDTATPC